LRKEEEEVLIRGEGAGVLNIQQLTVRSPPHSSSYLECKEGKKNHEKMKFVHPIIQDIYRSGTSVLEFLRRHRRSWSSSEQGGLRTTPVGPLYIQESYKEGVE
jgi:hypothetical protein